MVWSITDNIRSLEGKVALLSGAGGGMGRAIAQAFAELGATVVIIDISRERVEEAEALIGGQRGKAVGIVADVTQQADLGTVVKEVEERFGRLNILVNNVGATLGLLKSFSESTEEEWESLYRINLWHIFALTHRTLPLLKKGGRGGSVINVSTIEAFRGFPLGTVYSAFKAGVTGFTQSLALELAPDGIRVNAIAPETTTSWSNDFTRWLPADETEHIKHWVPLERFGLSEDAAGCAVFLASDMSAWVTGTTIHLDGGCLAAAGWVRTEEGQWTHRPIIKGTRWPPRRSERRDIY